MNTIDAMNSGDYVCMPRKSLVAGSFRLDAVGPGDIEEIRVWRNQQMDVLRQLQPISKSEQSTYFETQIWPDKAKTDPHNILLAFRKDYSLIGYGGLVHVAWPHRRAEVSFLLDPRWAGQAELATAYFKQFLVLVKELGFGDLKLTRLHTETFAMRVEHIQALESVGFRHEGTLRNHVVIAGKQIDSLVHGCLSSDDPIE